MWKSFGVGSHSLPGLRDAGSSSLGPLPLKCLSYPATQHGHLTHSILDSNYTMSLVKCNISWIGLENTHPRAQHFLTVGMGINNWGCRARGFNLSSEGVSKGIVRQSIPFSLRMAHPPSTPSKEEPATCKSSTLSFARGSCWKTSLESEAPQFFFHLFVAVLPLQNSYCLFQHYH